jgi:hypothetical protein
MPSAQALDLTNSLLERRTIGDLWGELTARIRQENPKSPLTTDAETGAFYINAWAEAFDRMYSPEDISVLGTMSHTTEGRKAIWTALYGLLTEDAAFNASPLGQKVRASWAGFWASLPRAWSPVG